MTENLRSRLPDPTYHQDYVVKADAYELGAREEALDIALASKPPINQITRNHPGIAQEVAEAVKPEVDTIHYLQERIADPTLTGDALEVGGWSGHDNTDMQTLKLKAAKVDLEKNVEQATDRAVKQELGRIATVTNNIK